MFLVSFCKVAIQIGRMDLINCVLDENLRLSNIFYFKIGGTPRDIQREECGQREMYIRDRRERERESEREREREREMSLIYISARTRVLCITRALSCSKKKKFNWRQLYSSYNLCVLR